MQTTNRRSRFRYTLRAFFVVTTVACFAFYHWHVARKLRTAEAELRQLRSETGRITLDDETKLHAIAIDTGQPNTWRWRLFIPKGHRYFWNVSSKDIPLAKPPSRAGISGGSNEPYWERDNEVLVTARLRQDSDDEWMLSVESKIGDSKNQMAGVTLRIPIEDLDWTNHSHSIQQEILGNKTTVVVDPKNPVILLSRRPMKKLANGNMDFDDEPSPGFMIWLSPK